MMEDDMRDDMVMDLDLNQEPSEPPIAPVVGLGSLLNELETAHGQIEERIRQLEAVTARARQRQRWRQALNPPVASNTSTELINNVGGAEVRNGENSLGAQESTADRGKSCKRDSTHLVAKALEIDADVKRVSSAGGNFFDCNKCLDMARQPILTCCGHLFCWACFYQLPYVYSSSKECPECKGEVKDTNITPIYGNGNNVSELKSLLEIPPRPQAHRIESVRQQRVNRVVSHIPVAEALRRIRTGISLTRERPQRQNLDGVSNNSDRTSILASQALTSEALPNTEVGGSRRIRSHQFSRVLSESAASLSSISSALSDAERLVEDLESFIHHRDLRRTDSQYIQIDSGDSLTSNAAVLQSEHQTVDSTAEINSSEPLSSSSLITDVSAVGVHLENLTTDTAAEINLSVPRLSSSSRRRSGVSRVFDVDNGFSRERRRRRLG